MKYFKNLISKRWTFWDRWLVIQRFIVFGLLIVVFIGIWTIFYQVHLAKMDYKKNVNSTQAITKMVKDHIKALDGIDNADVSIIIPSKPEYPAASVIITIKPDSDFYINQMKIRRIEYLLLYAVEDLWRENIVICDQNGLMLNDF